MSASLSNDLVQLTKHIPVGSLQLYTDYKNKQINFDIEIHEIITGKKNDALPCILQEAELVCSPTEVDSQRKINLGMQNSLPRNAENVR